MNTAEVSASHSRRERLGKLFIGIWATVCVFALASLSVNHMFPMPAPKLHAVDALARELGSLRRTDKPLTVHVIAADCSCTDSLVTHLFDTGAATQREELILYVGVDPERAQLARAAGYRFLEIQHSDLVSMGLEAAPVLAIFSDQGDARYLGGYYDHPAAVFPKDTWVESELMTGVDPEPLPIYGCAVSSRLRGMLDPLGIVYGSNADG